MVREELVPLAAATTLGVREQPGRPLLDALAHSLRDRWLLLVLDNCEHLVAACAELVGSLLVSCPGLCILATSREPLQVPGEVAWRVPSLSVPEPSDARLIESLLAHDSVQLLAERARKARPDLELTDAHAPALAEICRRLDGMPLAVELAAAQASVMGIPST